MTEVTISQLERMTGATFKTIKKRLGDLEPSRRSGQEIYYKTQQALSLLYAPSDDDIMDLTKERARLAKVQADKIELEILKMKEKLVDRDVWGDEFSKVFISFKDKLRNMALKIADKVARSASRDEVYFIIDQYAHEVLEEIVRDAGHFTTNEEELP